MSNLSQRVFGNALFQIFGAFGVSGMNFLLMLCYARFLGPESFGSLVTAQAAVLVWTILIDLGLSNALISVLSTKGNSISDRSILQKVLIARLSGCFIGSAVILVISLMKVKAGEFLYGDDDFLLSIAFIPYLFALALQLTASAYANYRSYQKLSVVFTVVATSISVMLCIFLAWQKAPLWQLLFFQSLAGIFMAFLLWVAFTFFLSKPQKSLQDSKLFDLQVWKNILQHSWPYALSFMALVFWQRLDQLSVSYFLDKNAEGQYGLAARLVAIPILMASASSTALFPDMQKLGQLEPQKVSIFLGAVAKFFFRYGFFLSLAMLFFIMLLIEPFDSRYSQAASILPFFSLGVWAFWLQMFFLQGLYAIRSYRLATMAHLLALVPYLTFLYFFTEHLGLYGVALAFDIFLIALCLFAFAALKRAKILAKDFQFWQAYSDEEKLFIQGLRNRLLQRRSA